MKKQEEIEKEVAALEARLERMDRLAEGLTLEFTQVIMIQRITMCKLQLSVLEWVLEDE